MSQRDCAVGTNGMKEGIVMLTVTMISAKSEVKLQVWVCLEWRVTKCKAILAAVWSKKVKMWGQTPKFTILKSADQNNQVHFLLQRQTQRENQWPKHSTWQRILGTILYWNCNAVLAYTSKCHFHTMWLLAELGVWELCVCIRSYLLVSDVVSFHLHSISQRATVVYIQPFISVLLCHCATQKGAIEKALTSIDYILKRAGIILLSV